MIEIVNESPARGFFERMAALENAVLVEWRDINRAPSYHEEVLMSCLTFEDFLERTLRHDFYAETESTIRELRRACIVEMN